MKKLLFVLISSLILISCRKQQFQPCQEYENIVGTWESITGDGTDLITITTDGKYIYDSALERNRTYKFWTCEWKLDSYFKFFTNRKRDEFLTIFPNATFDTLVSGSGAYNHMDSSMIDYGRKFVRIN